MKRKLDNTLNPQFVSYGDQSIYGTLTPIEWDENDKVISYSIFTDEEEDIIIKSFSKPKKLKKLHGKKVVAKGKIKYDAQNNERYIDLKKLSKSNTFPHTSDLKKTLSFYEELKLTIPACSYFQQNEFPFAS